MASPSDASLPRALITGLSGFTGRYVAAELVAAGYEVHGLTRRAGEVDVPVDLLDRQSLREAIEAIAPTVVIHLAAIAFVAHGDVDAMYRVNVVGTRNLLDALASLTIVPKLVVLASSANIYGNADVERITEDTPPAPANDYAVSKLAMENMAKLWMDRLPIVITRPFNYTGAGQSEKFLIPKIIYHFRKKASVIELGNTEVVRDFSDVRDVAKAYREILNASPVGRTVNICSGTGYSLNKILETVSGLAGYDIQVKVNPAFLRSNEVSRLLGSPALLYQETGWQPIYPLIDTLEWIYRS